MNTLKSAYGGFSLVELMVTLALVVILMAVVVPSITTFQRNAQLTSFVNSLVGALNTTRGEAMKRGMNAMVVPSDGATWRSGWVAFVDANRSNTYTQANDVTILTMGPAPSYLTISGTGTVNVTSPYILFDASGYSKTTAGGFGALTFSVTRNDVSSTSEIRRIIIASTGRVRSCNPSTDSTCTASATQ